MRYIREFQTGTGSDPRDKWIAVFKCDACGHEDWIPMSDRHTFKKEPRTCPACKVKEPEDLAKLLAQKASLEAEQVRISLELERITAQLRAYDHREAECPVVAPCSCR